MSKGQWENFDETLHSNVQSRVIPETGSIDSNVTLKPDDGISSLTSLSNLSNKNDSGSKLKFSADPDEVFSNDFDPSPATVSTLGVDLAKSGLTVINDYYLIIVHMERPSRIKSLGWTGKKYVPVLLTIKQGNLFIYDNPEAAKILNKVIHVTNIKQIVEKTYNNRKKVVSNHWFGRLDFREAKNHKSGKLKESSITFRFTAVNEATALWEAITNEQKFFMSNAQRFDGIRVVPVGVAEEKMTKMRDMVKRTALTNLIYIYDRLSWKYLKMLQSHSFNTLYTYGYKSDLQKQSHGINEKAFRTRELDEEIGVYNHHLHSLETSSLGAIIIDQWYRKRMAIVFLRLRIIEARSELNSYEDNIRIVLASAIDYSVHLYAQNIKSARKAKLASLFRKMWLRRQLFSFNRIKSFGDHNMFVTINRRMLSKHLMHWLRSRNRLCEGTIISHWLSVSITERRRYDSICTFLKKQNTMRMVQAFKRWAGKIVEIKDRNSMFALILEGVLTRSKERMKSSALRMIDEKAYRNISKLREEEIHMVSLANSSIKATFDIVPKERAVNLLHCVIKNYERELKLSAIEIIRWKVKFWDINYRTCIQGGANALKELYKSHKLRMYLHYLNQVRSLVKAKSVPIKSVYHQLKSLGVMKMVNVLRRVFTGEYRLAWNNMIEREGTATEIINISRDVILGEDHRKEVNIMRFSYGSRVLKSVVEKIEKRSFNEVWDMFVFHVLNYGKKTMRRNEFTGFSRLDKSPPPIPADEVSREWFSELWRPGGNAVRQLDVIDDKSANAPLFGAKNLESYRENLLGFLPLSSFSILRAQRAFCSHPQRRSFVDILWIIKIKEQNQMNEWS